MVLKDGIKLLDVFRVEQGSQRSHGECSEGLVGRSEDSEGTLGRECSDELASFERGDQSGERWRGDSELNNVLCWWHEHTIDDVHHSVDRTEVGLGDGDLGVLNIDSRVDLVDPELLSLEGLDMLECLQILCIHSIPGNHMVLKDGIKLLDVFRVEQGSQRSHGECSEGLVGRSEDSEGTLGRECSDELASFERGDQSGERWRGDSELNNVLCWWHEHPM